MDPLGNLISIVQHEALATARSALGTTLPVADVGSVFVFLDLEVEGSFRSRDIPTTPDEILELA